MAKLNTKLYIAPPGAKAALNGFRVQMVTSTVRIRNGDQALKISPKLYGLGWLPLGCTTAAPTLPLASANERLGCQTLRNRVRQIRLARAEVMSGSSGPMKLEVKYWVTAKLRPATRAAGQVSFTPRRPSIMNTSQNGTNSDSSGSWRPVMAPMWKASMPVTWPATMIGMPRAPKATGAVLAIRHRPAAYSGLKPRPTSKAAVIATGAPKPAAPSRKAPKQKPISSTCRRWSSVIDSTELRITSNWPLLTVSLYRNTAATMIQAIGQRP